MSGYGVLTKSYWLGYYRATTSATAPWYSDDDPLNPTVPQPTAGPRNADPYKHWWAAAGLLLHQPPARRQQQGWTHDSNTPSDALRRTVVASLTFVD
jgi:hypothetical protein